VDGVDFTVERGTCVGLLGPNGAGKTTTLRILTCLASRDAGDVSILGLDPAIAPRAVKQRLGVVSQENTLDLELTVRENLTVFARYFGIRDADAVQRTEKLLQFMEIAHRAEHRVDRLSGGMQRRLQIARALVSDPELVVLDEPTTGLDPHARHVVWERLRRLRAAGATLLLTTHYMDEAAQLCDRVAIMSAGRVIAEGPPQELVERVVGAWTATIRSPAEPVMAAAAAAGMGAHRIGDGLVAVFGPSGEALAELAGEGALELSRPASLEDVFLVLTGTQLHQDG
jgi:lipooligosaccharide transport system ATP-binding protein